LTNNYFIEGDPKRQATTKNYQKFLSKPTNKIRFIPQINLSIKRYNIIRWY